MDIIPPGREYNLKLLNENLIRLPLDYRNTITDNKFILNRGFGKFLNLFDWKNWEKQVDIFNQADRTDAEIRSFMRLYYRGASEQNADPSGNIRIPAKLIEYAGLKDDILLLIVPYGLEIWAKENYLITERT